MDEAELGRDGVVAFTVANLAVFTSEGTRAGALDHEQLRTIRAMAWTVYLAAMPSHTTLEGPEDLLPLMRSDWGLIMEAWNQAGDPQTP